MNARYYIVVKFTGDTHHSVVVKTQGYETLEKAKQAVEALDQKQYKKLNGTIVAIEP